MAKKVKENLNSPVGNTIFNVQPIHIERIKTLVQRGHKKVIIHGDGSMFAGPDAQLGSDHHKEFNSGVEEINKNEIVSRAKFRAFYNSDNIPESVEQVVEDFYTNNAKEIQSLTTPNENKGFENTVSV